MFELPLGFGYALAQNIRAKDYFMSKSEQEQKEMIHRAQQLQSDEEMLKYVEGLAKKNDAPLSISCIIFTKKRYCRFLICLNIIMVGGDDCGKTESLPLHQCRR